MSHRRAPATVFVDTETERDGGWVFDARLPRGDGEHAIALRLSWPDYEYWSAATVSPVAVARAVLEVAAAHLERSSLPATIDASRIRRLIPGCDDLIRERLAPPPAEGNP